MRTSINYSKKMLKNQIQENNDEIREITFAHMSKYIIKFLLSCPLSESAFIRTLTVT